MSDRSFFSLLHDAMDLFQHGKLQEAYDLIDSHMGEVGGNPPHLLNLRYCAAALMGKDELALRLMRESVVGTDYWYGYDYLYSDEDLKSIRDRPEFKELAEICRAREAKARRASVGDMKITMPMGGVSSEKPAVVALHGNGDSVALNEQQWLPLVQEGHLLAMPQSSQILFYGAYTWQDLTVGGAQLAPQINWLQGRGNNDYILSGFSGGGRMALYGVLFCGLRPKGLILVSSWLPELDNWKDEIERLSGSGIKVCLLCGEKDENCVDAYKKLSKMLDQAGIPVLLEVVKDLGHDFPDDFSERSARMIEFIEK